MSTPYHKNTQVVYIYRNTSHLPMKLHMLYITETKDDWQPITATSEMLISQLGHLHMLEVTVSLIDSSRG